MHRHAINVGDTMAYKALGLLLAKEHRFQEASDVFQRAIVSGITQLHFESGATLWMLGDYRRAEEEYRAPLRSGTSAHPTHWASYLMSWNVRKKQSQRCDRRKHQETRPPLRDCSAWRKA